MTEKDVRKRYLGTPYKHLGRDLSGIDCWGVIMDAFKFFKDVLIVDVNCYSNMGVTPADFNIENYYKNWKQHGAPAFFDLLIFEHEEREGLHAGLYLGHGEFIHATRAGVVVSRVQDKRWGNRLIGIFRYEGVK